MEMIKGKCSKCGKSIEVVKFMADMGVPSSCHNCDRKMFRRMRRKKAF